MEELLEEFFDKTFEDTINEEMFSYDYSFPEEQLEDYVLSLMAIPYKEFINYVATRYCSKAISPAEIPQISSYESATLGVTEVLHNLNDPGLECLEIGIQLFSDGKERKDGAYFKFGENHVKGAYFHGLTHCSAKKWFLTCLGRIYPDMDEEMRQYLSARTLLRNPLFHIVVAEATKHDVNIRFFMPGLSEATEKRRSSSCMHFFNIIAHQCRIEGVKLHRIYYESERKEVYWIVPSNDETFRLSDYFEYNDEVDWKQRNDFAASDTIYLYNSKPQHRIAFETKVVAADLTIDEYKSAKEYWNDLNEYEAGVKDNRFVRLRLTNKISKNKKLSLENLREHGLKGNLQSSKKVNNELLDYIQSEINREEPPMVNECADDILY